ncbi:MAG: TIGR00341 family protein [Spirochaetales bacterium]|nr:TIGR00341 family protein [Spirochaetales bacterium]
MSKEHKENSENTESKDKEKPDKIKNRDKNVEIIEEIEGEKALEKKKGFLSHIFSRVKEEKFFVLKKGVGGVIDEYRVYKDRKGEVLGKFEAYETVVAGATDTIEYYVLLILSCLIATLGLYQNSAAVIIGAMIVAPLMGPLFGFSAGMLWGSGKVIKEAVTTLLKGSLLVLVVTSVMTFFIPNIVPTNEILSRTVPSLFDVIIALSCGCIGAYAFVNKKVYSAIPGVAISVALMPPLCTVGIGIGLLNWEIARGAILLYAINLTGISIAATVIFFLVRLHPKAHDEKEFSKAKARALGQVLISLIIIILICIPLVFFMITTFRQNIEKKIIYDKVYSSLPGDRIYSMEIEPGPRMNVEIILLHRTTMPDINAAELEESIKQALNKEIDLEIYVISECNRQVMPEGMSDEPEEEILPPDQPEEGNPLSSGEVVE